MTFEKRFRAQSFSLLNYKKLMPTKIIFDFFENRITHDAAFTVIIIFFFS